MKNNFTNKTIAVFLTLVFVFGLIPSTVFAQTNPPLPSGEVRGFNRAVFDSHFSRADRELSPDRWLAEAKIGITQAISAWELIASGLYENPLIFDEAKNQIEKWSNEELEARFTKWLVGRFFGAAAEKSIMELSAMFGETQKKYSWRLDDEGNVIFDDITGDPLIIRPGEEDREFSRDLLSWRSEAENNLKANSDSFDNALLRLYPELLAYIPEELRESMSPLLYEAGSSITGIIRREFENIAAREERIFTNRRTRDIWSLRKKSDEEAADVFTERLIAETGDACAKGIEELNARIEEASAGNGDLVLLGEEWLQLYKEQFERGLKAWEEAEERFFVRRIEWEQDSINLFYEGEETWQTAFKQFDEERKKWELKVKDLLDSGEQLFKNISESLEKNITDARKEFEANMKMRIGAGASKVKAIVDMYLICSSAALTMRENVLFWLKLYDSDIKEDPKEPGFSDWLMNERDKKNDGSFNEIKKSYDQYVLYIEKALDARDRILADYAELIGNGTLKDILAPDASSEDFCLDEYQIALVKSKALVSYWERKTAIAKAVMTYAGEIDAGRMTDSEGIHNWENAKSAYNESIAAYEAEMGKLNEIGADIKKQQEKLDELSKGLAAAEEELNRLNQELAAYTAASKINIEFFAQEDLKDMYDRLLADYIEFQKTGDEAAYKNIFEYGMKWEILDQKENAEYVLGILLNGNGKDIPSLTELKENILKESNSELDLNIRLASIYLFADPLDGKLRDTDSTFSSADWYSRIKGVNLSEDEKTALYGEKLGAQLLEDYNKSFRALLEKRLSLELDFLFNYLNEYPELDSFDYKLSESGMANTENFSYFYEVLSALKNRLETGNDYFTEDEQEDEFIDFFISGGSFFSGYEKYLTSLYNDYLFCENLFYLYNNYGILSSFTQKEILQNTKDSLSGLFSRYSIQTGNVFPDMQSLLISIKNKPGNFMDNAAQFMLDFDKCFIYIPQWLENEIDQWKTALTNYIAAYSLQNNIQPLKDSVEIAKEYEESKENILYYLYSITIVRENFNNEANKNENEKHWRQYLGTNYFSEIDPALSIASSWKEGVFEDALYDAIYYTNRINDSFKYFSNSNLNSEGIDSEMFFYMYSGENQDVSGKYALLKRYFASFMVYGKAVDISKKSTDEAIEGLGILSKDLKAQEDKFNSLRENYLSEVEKFIDIGKHYDEQYSVTKKAYDDIDVKRFEYEKQDAIQRWASTAYLGTDNFNYDEYKNHLDKAQMVLTVLSSLYNNEESRSYNNSEYDALYTKYEQSFNQKIKILDALETIKTEIAQEKINKEELFENYQESLHNLEDLYTKYAEYTLPDKASLFWELKDMITVNNGLLAFSRDSSMNLNGVNDSTAALLNDYFNNKNITDIGNNNISQFEEALRGLTERMKIYFDDDNKQRQWGLARDYLILSLLDPGNIHIPGYPQTLLFRNKFLYDNYVGIGDLGYEGALGKLPIGYISFNQIVKDTTFEYLKGLNVPSLNEVLCTFAWYTLSEEERADLEFYLILTLSDKSDYVNGFSHVGTLEAYDRASSLIHSEYSKLKKQNDKWDFLVSDNTINLTKFIMERVENGKIGVEGAVDNWKTGINDNLSLINNLSSSYAKSIEKLKYMEGKKENGEVINWNDIYYSLDATDKFSINEINTIKSYWEQMQEDPKGTYNSVYDALLSLFYWSKNEESKNKTNLDVFWYDEEKKQEKNETAFQKAINEFFAGTGDIAAVKNAAEKAYGNNTAAWKNHYTNLHTVLKKNLVLYMETKNNLFTEFELLGDEFAQLTMETMRNRYNAELAAREIEWNQMRLDILEKSYEWLDSAAQILESGRTDWDNGFQKMEEAHKQWTANFKNEYNRVSNEWAEAYLAGLEDKEKWLEQAAEAANQASMESLLSLIGTEGERLSRFIDTREPFGIRDAIPETETLMAELLQASGITNMATALNSLNNISNTISSVVRRGMGGISIWDASLVKAAASDLAREINAEIADSEARRLARIAKINADEAIKSIYDNVDSANKSFGESMDNYFMMSGYWRKNGNNYEKDIIKGSTLTTSVISEKAFVEGYRNFILEPVTLKTDLDEKKLETLDSNTINYLLRNAYKEVKDISSEIFEGKDEESKIIKGEDTLNNYFSKVFGSNVEDIKVFLDKIKEGTTIGDREQSPGKFGAHIGYVPATKQPNPDDIENSLFYDKGDGELGRLMSEFIYWSVIDDIGVSELCLPSWDKRIWDDSDSFIKSPTLRSTMQIVGAIAATVVVGVVSFGAGVPAMIAMMAVSIGINTADDLIFGALDVGYGYKSIEEAGFEFGKNLAINTISSAASLGTGVAASAIITKGAIAGAATKALINGSLSAAGSYTTSVATSYIAAYDFKTGYFDKEAANRSWYSAGTIAGALGAGVSSGLGSYLKNSGVISYPQQKYWGGAINLATAVSGESTKYGVYAAYNLGAGMGLANSFRKAYDDMGGLTINVANLGAMFDFVMSTVARNNDTGQPADTASGVKTIGNVLNELSNVGLLEINFGSKGISANFGTGGIDVGGALYDLAKRGIDYSRIQNMKNEEIKKIALKNYEWGDWTAENTSMRIASELDELRFGSVNNGIGYTVSNGIGGRTITIQDSGDVNMNAVFLQHEAYRSGLKNDLSVETLLAATAHTEMANRMRDAGILNDSVNTKMDSLVLKLATESGDMSIWEKYVSKIYDSSDSYWKLMNNGSLQNDNSGLLTYENGKPVLNANNEQVGGKGIETGLLNILFGGTSGVKYENYSDEQIGFAQSLMIAAGMKYTEVENGDIRERSWRGNDPGQSLNMQRVMEGVGNTVAAAVFAQYYESAAIAASAWLLGKNGGGMNNNFIPDNAFSRFYSELLPAVLGYSTSMRHFLDNVGDDPGQFRVTGRHDERNPKYLYPNYENDAHFGTDIANGKSGDPIYMGIPGTVIWTEAEKEKQLNEETGKLEGVGNGNWMAVEYGYMFEGSFIGSGIYGEYMHMEKKPDLKDGLYLDSKQVIGTVGNTGRSDGPHLHYSIYTLENYAFSQTTLLMLFNNNISNTVVSREAKSFGGTYNRTAKKITYNIENYLRGLK